MIFLSWFLYNWICTRKTSSWYLWLLRFMLKVLGDGKDVGWPASTEFYRALYHNLACQRSHRTKSTCGHDTARTSVGSHRNKASWRKLDLGYRQPQVTCYHKLPHGCSTFTKRQFFSGPVSHCSKSLFSFVYMQHEITYALFLKLQKNGTHERPFLYPIP